jgi:hypothetical protein
MMRCAWRKATVGVVALAAGAAVGGALWAGAAGGMGPGIRSAAAQEVEGTDTYILSDPQIRYPFHPTPPGQEVIPGTVDPTQAGVSFAAAWSGTRFPGEVWCTAILRDAAGQVVGTERFSAAGLAPAGRFGWVRVEVSGEPVSAEGSCEPGSYAPGPGYVVEQLHVEAAGPKTSVARGTIRWASEGYPSARVCELRAALADGGDHVFRFTLDAPDGTAYEESIPASVDRVRDVSVTCSEIPEVGAG